VRQHEGRQKVRVHEFDNKLNAVNYFGRRSNIIGRIDSGEYTIFLDEHLMYRQQGRDVDEFVIQDVIPKISHAKAKIKLMNTGQSFYVYDNSNKIALGVKILNIEHKILLVKTVWPGIPNDAKYPIFNVA
jgi:hypothetical protein